MIGKIIADIIKSIVVSFIAEWERAYFKERKRKKINKLVKNADIKSVLRFWKQ